MHACEHISLHLNAFFLAPKKRDIFSQNRSTDTDASMHRMSAVQKNLNSWKFTHTEMILCNRQIRHKHTFITFPISKKKEELFAELCRPKKNIYYSIQNLFHVIKVALILSEEKKENKNRIRRFERHKSFVINCVLQTTCLRTPFKCQTPYDIFFFGYSHFLQLFVPNDRTQQTN